MKGLFSRARTASGAPSDENRTGSLTNSEKSNKNKRKKIWKTEKEIFQEMHKIGVNVNQLAKVANTTGAATPEDIVEVKGMLDNLWHILKRDAQWIKEQ